MKKKKKKEERHNLSISEIKKTAGAAKSMKVSIINPLSVNPTKWSNTLKQFVSKLPMNCLSVFDHIVKLALKGHLKSPKGKFFFKFSLLSFSNSGIIMSL